MSRTIFPPKLRHVLPYAAIACCTGLGVDVVRAENEPQPEESTDVFELSLEELVQVNILNRSGQGLSDSPGAVSVLTAEDIRRSRATSLPEVLRLVPGLSVNRLSGSTYSVGIRGDQGRFADKILVLIDGRSVYLPSFGGVPWDLVDVYLPDIERIEIVRGPGASLWGGNAMNGVINIITKQAQDTSQFQATTAVGNQTRFMMGARESFSFGDTKGRVSASTQRLTANEQDRGGASFDATTRGSAYLRLDTPLGAVDHTMQVRANFTHAEDVVGIPGLQYPLVQTQSLGYNAPSDSYSFLKLEQEKDMLHTISMQNVWEKKSQGVTDWRFSLTGDTVQYAGPLFGDYDASIIDADFQAREVLGRHALGYGISAKMTFDSWDTSSTERMTISPKNKAFSIVDTFLYDEIALWQDRVTLSVGTKLEYNDFSGLEYEPTIRVISRLSQTVRVWAGVSRAIRRPNRVNNGLYFVSDAAPPSSDIPLPYTQSITQGHTSISEVLYAYEMGIRGEQQIGKTPVEWDLSAFINDYSKLVGPIPTDLPSPPPFSPFQIPHLDFSLPLVHGYSLQTQGVETVLRVPLTSWIKLSAWYALLHTNDGDLGSGASAPPSQPKHQAMIRFQTNPTTATQFDITYRTTTGGNDTWSRSDHRALDLRAAWHLDQAWTLEALGTDLLDRSSGACQA